MKLSRVCFGLWLAAIACIVGPAKSFWQSRDSNYNQNVIGGVSCTPGTPATNFLARTSGLSGTETDAYCVLINGLVTDSIITGNLSGATGCGTVLDGLYMFATKNTTEANRNLCGTSFGITVGGSPTFTADRGYTGDATTAFLDTGYQLLTGGGNFAESSGAVGACILNARTTALLYTAVGAEESTGSTSQTFIILNGLQGLFRVNSDNGVAPVITSSQGTWISSRTASNLTTAYLNGASIGTSAQAGQARAAANLYFLATNQAGVGAIAFSGDQIGAGFLGAGLDATKAAAISSRISAFITSVGGSGC